MDQEKAVCQCKSEQIVARQGDDAVNVNEHMDLEATQEWNQQISLGMMEQM